jgi:hypothetical protein
MPDTSTPLALPVPRGLERSMLGLVALLRTVAFWLSVALPAAYPVVLLASLETLPLLLGAHVLAVTVGHGHQPGGGLLPRGTG